MHSESSSYFSPTGATSVTTVGPCMDKDANCARYPAGTCTDPQYVAWAKENCSKFCNLCPCKCFCCINEYVNYPYYYYYYSTKAM